MPSAATVASQWLQLLHQDIKGRLAGEFSFIDNMTCEFYSLGDEITQVGCYICGSVAALRRSKKRVRAVITTELPSLLSKEFPSNQENELYVVKDFATGYSSKATAELHQSHWGKLFNQMDSKLSDEEKQLVNQKEKNSINRCHLSSLYILFRVLRLIFFLEQSY